MTDEEFDKLEIGDLVRGAFSGMGFRLAERIPHGFIGVRRQQITNPDEWKLIQKRDDSKSKPPDIEPLRARLTATEAALSAAQQYVKILREYIAPRELLKGIDEARDGQNYRAALSRLAETRGSDAG